MNEREKQESVKRESTSPTAEVWAVIRYRLGGLEVGLYGTQSQLDQMRIEAYAGGSAASSAQTGAPQEAGWGTGGIVM